MIRTWNNIAIDESKWSASSEKKKKNQNNAKRDASRQFENENHKKNMDENGWNKFMDFIKVVLSGLFVVSLHIFAI